MPSTVRSGSTGLDSGCCTTRPSTYLDLAIDSVDEAMFNHLLDRVYDIADAERIWMGL